MFVLNLNEIYCNEQDLQKKSEFQTIFQWTILSVNHMGSSDCSFIQ